MRTYFQVSPMRVLVDILPDARARKMPKPISIFYHHQGKFDCPVCGGAAIRAHTQGWFWYCPRCDKEFPLYEVSPHPEEEVVAEKKEKGFLGKLKEKILGG